MPKKLTKEVSSFDLKNRAPHFAPRARRVIFLFMQGGVSHVDSYDYKPRLEKDDGQMFDFHDARKIANRSLRAKTPAEVEQALTEFLSPQERR